MSGNSSPPQATPAVPATSPCPCATCTFPVVVHNPPAQPTITYRWGDYTGFRAALLVPAASPPMPAETELSQPGGEAIWRPTAGSGDLALQVAEWWAYLADILTLYTERAANQSYIRTADLPESLPRLVPLLGYRPAPAIGAQVTLAGLVRGPRPVTLPQGLQVQSKPGPGQQPQVFELSAQTVIQPVPAVPSVPQTTLMPALTTGQTTGQVLLASNPGNLKVGDEVLLLSSTWNGTDATYAVCSVTAIAPATGGTSVAFNITSLGGGNGVPGAANWQLLKASSSSPIYPYMANPPYAIVQTAGGPLVAQAIDAERAPIRGARLGARVIPSAGSAFDIGATTATSNGLVSAVDTGAISAAGAGAASAGVTGFASAAYYPITSEAYQPIYIPPSNTVELASVVRSIAPGAVIVVENPVAGSTIVPVPGYVTSVTELISYANNPSNPSQWPPAGSPANTTEPAVPIPHTMLSFNTMGTLVPADASSLIVRYGYAAVGTLIDPPVAGAVQTGSITLNPAGLAASGLATNAPLLVADANGDGATATLGTGGVVTIDPAPPLVPPLQVFSNLLAFTRGKTIQQEVLGNGNPAIAGQNFTLQTAPVTYLAAQPGVSGPGYSSTITLWVNGVQWAEVPTFYGQGPTAQVFVTQEDTSGNTHVLGGDGVNGARFPSGTNNIVANYRIGSGAALPPPTSVSVLLQPQPGLQALVNPVPPSGGADSAASSALRQLAPQSVVTFGRAVSVDDYAAIAAATPGVARVSAAYAFDPVQQRPVVTLWVGDDSQAVGKAQAAIAPISDPNRPISIKAANPVQISIALTYVRDPRYLDAAVLAGVRTALADPSVGLFGSNVVQIGQAFYDSQIYAVCLKVPGVQAVHNLQVTVGPPPVIYYVWQLSSVWVGGLRRTISAAGGCTGHRYSPGADGFFALQNTPATLQLSGTPGT